MHVQTAGRAERWQLDPGAADLYRQWLVPVIFDPWAEELVGRAEVHPDERVLDLACGTGAVARCVVRQARARDVWGVDSNASMLELAQADEPSIQWRVGPAEQLPFPDSMFDVVLCQQGLQFFNDQRRAIGEVRRILRPGGRILASVWAGLDRNPFPSALIAACRSCDLETFAEALEKPFRSSRDQIAGLLTGFRAVELIPARVTCIAANAALFIEKFLCALPVAAGVDPRVFQPVVLNALSNLGSHVNGNGLAVPFEAWVMSGCVNRFETSTIS